ncbi:hypothetical protein GVN16_17565 [Emticicia sp. CRIBPO]|uniref:hypothetical protein n=1 Tax=Emticicia sp. CRIBPO TaxID=2683258 RepID=UPI001412088D|nr:hypothetical protein [Emticicia sp. CRIBPO]NBA87584.1 hypothetical protein [Emticicia sp. CRIBPO]
MKKLSMSMLILSTMLFSCKEDVAKVNQRPDQCKPQDPVTYYELKDAEVVVIGLHKASGRLRVIFKDTTNMDFKLKLFYPELLHELTPDCCPCNLPVQYQKEGQAFKISGVSRIERSSLEFYQNLVENPTNQPHDGDDCLPFEITKIEAID